MEDFIWAKSTGLDQFIFCVGAIFSVFNLLFWMIAFLYNMLNEKDRFWNPKVCRIVYVFGIIYIIIIVASIITTLLGY